MKVFKERWENGKLVTGDKVDAPPPVVPPQVDKLMSIYNVTPDTIRPKLFNRADAKGITDLSGGG